MISPETRKLRWKLFCYEGCVCTAKREQEDHSIGYGRLLLPLLCGIWLVSKSYGFCGILVELQEERSSPERWPAELRGSDSGDENIITMEKWCTVHSDEKAWNNEVVKYCKLLMVDILAWWTPSWVFHLWCSPKFVHCLVTPCLPLVVVPPTYA